VCSGLSFKYVARFVALALVPVFDHVLVPIFDLGFFVCALSGAFLFIFYFSPHVHWPLFLCWPLPFFIFLFFIFFIFLFFWFSMKFYDDEYRAIS